MSTFLVFVPIILYIGIPAAFLYVVYGMVNRWVNKSLNVRQEQNALLAKLIETLDKKASPSDLGIKCKTYYYMAAILRLAGLKVEEPVRVNFDNLAFYKAKGEHIEITFVSEVY